MRLAESRRQLVDGLRRVDGRTTGAIYVPHVGLGKLPFPQ
jgi:hypothetical protein